MTKRKKKLISALELSQSMAMFDAMNNEPPLACVLICASHIEKALGALLESFLNPCETSRNMLNNAFGVLSTFAARLDMCYSLGLIPKFMYVNLNRIREIRNLFAHSHEPVSFETPEVMAICNALTLPNAVDNLGNPVESPAIFKTTDPRSRFCQVAVMAQSRIVLTALGIQHRPADDGKDQVITKTST
jgi:hypothetical protein